MIRVFMIVVHGGTELAEMDADPARLADVSIDLLLASTAILVGLLLYAGSGSTLVKPGTGNPIPPRDIIVCCYVQTATLVLILFSSLGLTHFLPGYPDLLKVWLPDLFGVAALTWSMFKLA